MSSISPECRRDELNFSPADNPLVLRTRSLMIPNTEALFSTALSMYCNPKLNVRIGRTAGGGDSSNQPQLVMPSVKPSAVHLWVILAHEVDLP